MYYSLVSLGDECGTSIAEAVEYSPVLISFNPITAGQVTELVDKQGITVLLKLQGQGCLTRRFIQKLFV